MGDKNGGTYFVKQRRSCICGDVDINRSDTGRHGSEVLVQRMGVSGELHAFKIVGPYSDAEGAEPLLLIRRRRDGGSYRTATGISPPWLVNEIDPKTAAQEDVLKALSTVRRSLPCFGKLAYSMPHNKRKLAGFRWNLIKNVSVVATKSLSIGGGLVRVECAGIGNNCAADGKTALLPNGQRPFACTSLR